MPSSRHSVCVSMPMLDLRSVRQRRVNRTVAIAGEVYRLLDALLVVLAFPRGHAHHLALLDRPRPVLLLLAIDRHRPRLKSLFERLGYPNSAHTSASGQPAEQPLGATHRLAV